MRNRNWIVRRARELQAAGWSRGAWGRHHAWDERWLARRPFPREMGVHPHQLIARAIAASALYDRLLKKRTDPGWARGDARVFARLFRVANGESQQAFMRRMDRQRKQWWVSAVVLGEIYFLEGAAL